MPRSLVDFAIILLILVLLIALIAYYAMNFKDWSNVLSGKSNQTDLITNEQDSTEINLVNQATNSVKLTKEPLKVSITKQLITDLSTRELVENSFTIEDNQLTIPTVYIDVNQGSDVYTTAYRVDNTIILLNEEILNVVTTTTQPSTYAISAVIDLNEMEEGEYNLKVQKDIWEVDKLTNTPPKKLSKITLWDIFNIGDVSTTQPGFRKVKLYYANNQLDPDDCRLVAPVVREIPVSRTIQQDTINLLIKGELNEQEKAAGFSTGFPHNDFILTQAVLRNRVLNLNFNEVPGFTNGGSCRIMSLESQISKTSLQFTEVNEVVFDPPVFQP